MTRELITAWSDYQMALDRLLAIATHQILIYDEDLSQLALDSQRLAHLQRILNHSGPGALRIALRNTARLRNNHPRLLGLLGTWSHLAAAQQTPETLAHLRDSMILVDGRHGLIRFEQAHPRSKLLLDDPEAIGPYLHRFASIWDEGGEPVSAVTLGL